MLSHQFAFVLAVCERFLFKRLFVLVLCMCVCVCGRRWLKLCRHTPSSFQVAIGDCASLQGRCVVALLGTATPAKRGVEQGFV